jgi:3-hydroxyisobutyrate dehydrogenase
MGKGMARNISRAGFSLVVYNRTRSRAEDFAREQNCRVASTPVEAASDAGIVITMVSDVPDVEAVYLGPGGVGDAARPGLVAVDMSTVGPECARRVGAALVEKGAGFVDAPVSGGSWGAEQGTLSIMAGGSPEDYQRCVPVFEAMGKKLVHCGPVGSGQTTKLANQIVCALNLEAVCEGILFALKSGVNVENVLDAVGAGASASWAWSNLGPRAAAGDFAPGFKIDHLIKDMRLSIQAAASLGMNLPGVALVLNHLLLLQKSGRGSEGTQALIDALK